tara:strand:- start:49 stop:327 length:279 start_codon:yes stop_codon:yes gene_type:complete
MADLHKAIFATHDNVISINGNTQESIVAKDKDQNIVSINWTSVNAWTDPDEYKYKRASEYPAIEDQLDDIYHNGIDGWKETIKAVKDKYPKG